MSTWNAETAEWYAAKYGEYATNRLAADAAQLTGPAILLFGLGPARAEVHLPQLIEDLA